MIGRAHRNIADSTPIAWSEMGEGDPLVLIHGFQQSHRTWRRVAPELAKDFHVLMPDLPGHGFSGRSDAPYTLAWYARTISAWMDTIGIPQAHVCGHSFGGGIAQWMLLERREKVNRLALVAPGGLGHEVGMGLRFATIPVLGPAFTPLVIRYGLPFVMRHVPSLFGQIEPEEVTIAAETNRIPGTDRAFQRSVAAVINLSGQHMQSLDHIREVATLPPIALFWGEKDPILPVKHGREAFKNSTGIVLTTYPDVGHFPQLDVPSLFTRDLRAFLLDKRKLSARMPPLVAVTMATKKKSSGRPVQPNKSKKSTAPRGLQK
jgi:pimeloyl-ACP methyl ester carboxylesterase